jgi:hypothetical protein
MRDIFRELVPSSVLGSVSSQAPVAPDNTPQQDVQSGTRNGFNVWSWGNKISRAVPKSYVFPKGAFWSVSYLFMYGIPANNIMPFRMIDTQDFARDQQAYVSKAKKVFSYVIQQIALVNSTRFPDVPSIFAIPQSQWHEHLCVALVHLVGRAQDSTGRAPRESMQLVSYCTLYNTFKSASIPVAAQYLLK